MSILMTKPLSPETFVPPPVPEVALSFLCDSLLLWGQGLKARHGGASQFHKSGLSAFLGCCICLHFLYTR